MPKSTGRKKKMTRAEWVEEKCPELEEYPPAERAKVKKFHRIQHSDGSESKACMCSAFIEDASTGRQRKCRRPALASSIFCSVHKKKGDRTASRNFPIYDRKAKGHDKRMDLPGFVGSNFYGCGCSY